jgi:hypothetical protein
MLRKAIFVAAAALAIAGSANADTLLIDGIASGSDSVPTAGITKDRVAANWGEPASKIAAVGEPPISRWVYDDFVVFFEFDHVIHTVAKR